MHGYIDTSMLQALFTVERQPSCTLIQHKLSQQRSTRWMFDFYFRLLNIDYLLDQHTQIIMTQMN